ncbi:hypothetical protein ACLOJK_035075 [Asimina triloba]
MDASLQSPTAICQRAHPQRLLFLRSDGKNFLVFGTKKKLWRISIRRVVTALYKSPTSSPTSLQFPIMQINGSTGKMGRDVAEKALSAGLKIIPVSFSSEEHSGQILQVGGTQIQVHGPTGREGILASIFDEHPNVIVVDYTTPDAVNGK